MTDNQQELYKCCGFLVLVINIIVKMHLLGISEQHGPPEERGELSWPR